MKITILGLTLCVMTIMGNIVGLEGGRGEGGFRTDYRKKTNGHGDIIVYA